MEINAFMGIWINMWRYDYGYVDEKQGRVGSGYDEHKEPLTEIIWINGCVDADEK